MLNKKAVSNSVILAGMTVLGILFLCPDLQALHLSPNYQVFTLAPGATGTGAVVVANDEGRPVMIKAYSKDWFVLNENKAEKATDWLVINVPKVKLKKGESKSIPFLLRASTNAIGELVGMVSVESVSSEASSIHQILSVAIYLGIQGTEQLKGDLVSFYVEPSSASHSVKAGVAVKNNGNVHLRPTGTVVVSDSSKKNVFLNIFLQQARPTYPGQIGTYSGQVYNFDLQPGDYIASITMTDIDRRNQFLASESALRVSPEGKVELIK